MSELAALLYLAFGFIFAVFFIWMEHGNPKYTFEGVDLIVLVLLWPLYLLMSGADGITNLVKKWKEEKVDG